jgi:16S rRNA processing protein RimM
VTRTQGLQGAVRVDLILDDDRFLTSGRQVQMETDGSRRTVKIEFFRRQHGRFVMKFAGIDSIEDAEKIIGAELRIPESEIPEAEEGSFYTFHLRGCRVYAIHEADGSAGDNNAEYIGDVVEVVNGGGTQLLQVGSGKEETLIPFAKSIVKKIDLADRRIEVELPKGLRELNK